MTSLGARSAIPLSVALLFAACGDLHREADPAPAEPRTAERTDPQAAPAPHGRISAARPELVARELGQLRSLGYLEGGASSQPVSPRKAGSGPRDADALSELHEKTWQSLNQRANEAFDYLGLGSFEAPSRVSRGERAEDERAAVSGAKPAPEPEKLGARLEELRFYRDAASNHALADKKLALELSRRRQRAGSSGVASLEGDAPGLSAAQRFERERRSLDDLVFQSPAAYWANTYVPGDPVMRWLESRVEKRDHSALQAFASQPLLLEDASHQMPQPFDAPSSAALSVFFQADRRGLEGESRMLVQVGLKGAERHAGLRPAMSVGIVLDLRGGLAPETAAAVRALLDGFLAAKDVGDRFSLVVAGEPGGELITPDQFRHGPLSLAMARLIEPAGARRPGEPLLSLEGALRHTAAGLRRGDDPGAPLGSSMVLLVTSQPLGSATPALSSAAHESAVAGVPLSVVGVGDGVELAELERVALAGQGNLRLMHAPAEAEALVERELSSLSRVIARALRLRIRLAPGVKLIEVVGSEVLDASGADRVRQAERSIDRRLARNLGIEADRGQDEGGIQIVIPTFYSGDTHAVLLDVAAPGPGPIADVTVRYKDLVYLRNGVARANLTLGRSSDPPGPLERNVVKNLLAVRLSETLKQAGRDLMAGGDEQAIASVRDFLDLLDGLRRDVPGFQNDADLAGDADMLGEYLAVLASNAIELEEPRQYLADSLQLSGYFKTVPRSSAALRISRR